ncbi:MAG: hypothetical protein ABIH82_05580 [Candidatus Woesearchaeota archaeon]
MFVYIGKGVLMKRNNKTSKNKANKENISSPIILFLLIGIIVVMSVSIIFNLIFLGESQNGMDSKNVENEVPKGMVTLQIIEPPKESLEEDVERGVGS